MTIRERIDSYQTEILQGYLLPGRAAEILAELAALIGNINEEIMKRDMEYNRVLLNLLDTSKTAATAKIQANTTPEYELMRIAHNTEKTAIEMIRSLKFYLKAKEDEYKTTKYQ